MTKSGGPLSTRIVAKCAAILIAVASFSLLSCTKLSRGLASTGLTGDDVPLVGDYSGGTFMLYQVLASQQSAGSQYDLIGQAGQFDTYCPEATSCMCEFIYEQGGATQTVQIAPTYQESNLLRCANQVPSGINTFKVRVVTTSGTDTSNTIDVNLSNGSFSGSTLFLDLTNSESFVQAKRFQCRKHEFIENPLDTATIDPFQSDDPRVIYPFNFYTTNVSESALQMQRLNNQTWECTLTATQDRSLHWWANANVYSASACTDSFCSGDGELMYPQTSLISGKIPVNNAASVGKRRGSFWLAKQSYGVFQIPLQAAIAPSSYVASTYGVIGYAAKPIPSTSGSSTCPAITLPPKATWVKIWNFRATDITPPKKVTMTPSSTMTAIACAPQAISRFPTCSGGRTSAGATFGTAISDPAVATGTGLASRIGLLDSQYGTANACYNVDPSAWLDGDDNTNAWYERAPEKWEPSPVGFGDPSATGGLPISQAKGLPWGLYSTIATACVGADAPTPLWRYSTGGCPVTSPGNAPPTGTPADNQVTAVALSTDNYTDQIFVVTDPNVDDTAMRNQSSSVSQYYPVTYRTAAECNGVSRAGCATNPIDWNLNVKEVGNPNSADLFPLCALQFYD